MKIYTLGYEKRNIIEYIAILVTAGVKKLIDVREVAWSYKRDFCKTKFTNSLAEADIEYIHIKELGNPKSIRKSGLTSEEILHNYKTYLNETESGIPSLLDIIKLACQEKQNICLTCFEKEHKDCHRSIITNHINPIILKNEIIHL